MDSGLQLKVILLLVSIGMWLFVVAETCTKSSKKSQTEPYISGYIMFCQDLRMLLSFAIGALFAQLLQEACFQNQCHGDGDDNDDHDEFDKKLGLYILTL